MASSYRNAAVVLYPESYDVANLSCRLDWHVKLHSTLVEWSYVLHDKDLLQDGSIKKPHVHLLMKFTSPVVLKSILSMLGLSDDDAHLIQAVRRSYRGTLLYLVHYGRPDKYQYSHTDVVASFDYQERFNDEISRIKAVDDFNIEEFIASVACGKIGSYEITRHVSGLNYVKYERRIKAAEAYYTRVLLSEQGDRMMDVVYIYGDSGTGKTTYAKYIASRNGYSVHQWFISGSGDDFLDGYRGEPCVILDDVRGSSMPLTMLLKLTDNHTSSSVRSRYSNKVLRCKLLIITSIFEPSEFYSQVFKDMGEQFHQFMRRLGMVIELDSDMVAHVHHYYSGDVVKSQHIDIQPLLRDLSSTSMVTNIVLTGDKALEIV